MAKNQSAYAQAGVDYSKIQPFKDAMVETAKRTAHFPTPRHVSVRTDILHSHGGVWRYTGHGSPIYCNTTEGLGNKNWLAEWMYQFDGTGRTHYEGIGIDTAMMAVNDVIAQGALPVVYTDEVAAGDSDWFKDEQRAKDLAEGFYQACRMSGMALIAGESPALKYLVRALEPVKSAPSLSGTVTGIIKHHRNLVTGQKLGADDYIVGVESSGVHSNGFSLLLKEGVKLKDQFLTKLPNGKTLGEELLTPTRCYVDLVAALANRNIQVNAFLPGTGDGVAKLAFDKRRLSYTVHSWPEIPMVFQLIRELFGLSWEDMLKTFNMGIGYYIFVPRREVSAVLEIAAQAGYKAWEIGCVDEGPRMTYFQPKGIKLPPPGA